MIKRINFHSIALISLLLIVNANTVNSIDKKKVLAQTPPLGWNSFDSYGINIYEEVAMKEIDAFIE